MRLKRLRSLVSVVPVVLLLSGLAAFNGGAPVLASAACSAGHVFVLNNSPFGANSITVLTRQPSCALSPTGVTTIGGVGSVFAFSNGTQGSLILSRDRTRLFAVDAGSDQISVVNVHDGQLSPVGVFPSGGSGPVSLTYQDGLLYVLNAANVSASPANVAGFHVAADGTLTPIPGATRPLSSAHPNPAEVLLDPYRRTLLVTEKNTNLIDLYRIAPDGSLSAPSSVPSVGAIPFGMAFNPASATENLIVADAAGGPNQTGAATAYRLADGRLRLVNGPVDDFQIAPCWMVVTRNGHFAYTSDADNFTITGYRIASDGSISLLNPSGVTATTPSDTFPVEEALSHDSRFLYVLDSRLLLPIAGPATISGFLIHADGSLTPVVDPASLALPFSAIGLAAD